MYVAIRYQNKINIRNETFYRFEAMIDDVFTRLRQQFFKDRRRTMGHGIILTHFCDSHGHKKLNKCK